MVNGISADGATDGGPSVVLQPSGKKKKEENNDNTPY